MNYLLVLILVVVVCVLIFTGAPNPESKLTIKKCRVCGSPCLLIGDFFDSQVQCSNQNCAITGPKRRDARDAISAWNSMFSNSKERQS